MRKRHLIGRGFVGVLVGGHGVNRAHGVVLRTRQQQAQRGGDWIFGWSCGCCRCFCRWSGSRSLCESDAADEEKHDEKSRFHGKPPEAFDDKPSEGERSLSLAKFGARRFCATRTVPRRGCYVYLGMATSWAAPWAAAIHSNVNTSPPNCSDRPSRW